MNAIRILRPILGPAVQRELSKRLERDVIAEILDDTFADYEEQRPNLPREPSIGGRIMVHLAALTIGLYRTLVDRDVPEDEARRQTAGVTWRVYEKMALLPTAMTRIRARTPYVAIKRATDAFRRFPFSAPAYVMEDVASDDDVVAFDVHRCPVAEYFRGQGLGELCVESWCNLDFPLARKWGARLERSHTIAGGARDCNFRWRVINTRGRR